MIRLLIFCLLLLSCDQSSMVTGKDINGLDRSCKPIEKMVPCTMSYEPGDRFADECRKLGGKAIMCGCHDYICQATSDL